MKTYRELDGYSDMVAYAEHNRLERSECKRMPLPETPASIKASSIPDLTKLISLCRRRHLLGFKAACFMNRRGSM